MNGSVVLGSERDSPDPSFSTCFFPSWRWREEGGVPYTPCFTLLWFAISSLLWFLLGRSHRCEEFVLCFVERLTPHGRAARDRVCLARQIVALHEALISSDSKTHCSAAKTSLVSFFRQEISPCVCRTSEDPRDSAQSCEVYREASKFVKAARNRSVGFVHALLATLLALYCVALDVSLRGDVVEGVSSAYTLTGLVSAGYFLWDIGVIFRNWGPDSAEWLLHGLISFFSVCSPFVFPSRQPMCFFAAALLLLEASTPFLTLRFFLLKAGAADTRSTSVITGLFALSFVCMRLGFGCLWLFPEIWRHLQEDPRLKEIARARRVFYFTAMPLFAALQIFWVAKLLVSLKTVPPPQQTRQRQRSKTE